MAGTKQVAGSLPPNTLVRIKLYQHMVFWGVVIAALCLFVWAFKSILLPFVLGIAIAYLLDPVMEKLSNWKFPRWAAALTILFVFFTFFIGILVLITPLLYKEAVHLINNAPQTFEKIWDMLTPYAGWIQQHFGNGAFEEFQSIVQENLGKTFSVGQKVLNHVFSGGQAVGSAVLNVMTLFIITPIVAFFMLLEWQNMTAWLDNLLPRQSHSTIRDLLSKIDRKISGFVRGQITIAFFLGLIYAVALTLSGLNLGFLIGMGAGFLSIIPLVGSTIGLIVSVGVAWFQSTSLEYTGMIAAIFIVGQFIEGNILTPKFLGESVGMHPLWILFAIMAGGSVLGLVGMFLAVPVAATIGVLLHFLITQYMKSPYYADAGGNKNAAPENTTAKKTAAGKTAATSKHKTGKDSKPE